MKRGRGWVSVLCKIHGRTIAAVTTSYAHDYENGGFKGIGDELMVLERMVPAPDSLQPLLGTRNKRDKMMRFTADELREAGWKPSAWYTEKRTPLDQVTADSIDGYCPDCRSYRSFSVHQLKAELAGLYAAADAAERGERGWPDLVALHV